MAMQLDPEHGRVVAGGVHLGVEPGSPRPGEKPFPCREMRVAECWAADTAFGGGADPRESLEVLAHALAVDPWQRPHASGKRRRLPAPKRGGGPRNGTAQMVRSASGCGRWPPAPPCRRPRSALP